MLFQTSLIFNLKLKVRQCNRFPRNWIWRHCWQKYDEIETIAAYWNHDKAIINHYWSLVPWNFYPQPWKFYLLLTAWLTFKYFFCGMDQEVWQRRVFGDSQTHLNTTISLVTKPLISVVCLCDVGLEEMTEVVWWGLPEEGRDMKVLWLRAGGGWAWPGLTGSSWDSGWPVETRHHQQQLASLAQSPPWHTHSPTCHLTQL